MGDGLSTDVLFDRHRVVGTALHRGVVGDEEAFATVHHTDAGDDAGGVRSTVVEFVGCERCEFKKGRPRVTDAFTAFSGQMLSS